jgi:hypothetical protein
LGCAHHFRPTYAWANVGHPSITSEAAMTQAPNGTVSLVQPSLRDWVVELVEGVGTDRSTPSRHAFRFIRQTGLGFWRRSFLRVWKKPGQTEMTRMNKELPYLISIVFRFRVMFQPV